jgi:hypothetical protein
LDERKRSEQPFVVVVRSQKGKFVGCTVSYPPGGLNLPEFPPLPKPTPAAAPPPKVAPQPVAKAEVPSLIIVGTKVGTNLNALTETAAPPAKPAPASANSPKPAVIQPPTQSPSTISSPIATNASTAAKPSQVETVLAPTKTNATTNATANATAALKPAQTNSVAAIALASSVPPAATRVAAAAVLPPTVKAAPVATSKAPVRQSGKWIGLGVVLLLAALVLAGWLVRRARRPRSSLITSSLQEPPARK